MSAVEEIKYKDGQDSKAESPIVETVPASPVAPVAVRNWTRRPFYKRRRWQVCMAVNVVLLVVIILLVIFPIAKAIVQHVVNGSKLSVSSVTMDAPRNDSFPVGMVGDISYSSSINGRISYTKPVDVSWIHDGDATKIGSFTLDPVSVKSHHGLINQTTTFTVADLTAMADFTVYMVTHQNFTWRLESSDVTVRTLGSLNVKGIKFSKDIVMNGINNFDGGVVLKSFNLNGTTFNSVTQYTNNSPFIWNLGTVQFNLTYQGITLGIGQSNNTLIENGQNEMTLSGAMAPHTNLNDLSTLAQLLAPKPGSAPQPVLAQGLSTVQNDGSYVGWLSAGLQALQLSVPFSISAL